MASGRSLLPLLLFFPFTLLGAGCDTPDEDYPQGAETISIGRAVFGRAVAVGIRQQTEEWEFCHPRMGEFGPWMDCEDTRQRAAHLVAIECTPADACRDVTLSGPKGSFFPLKDSFSVKVVGEIEGSPVETTRDVTVATPKVQVHLTPSQVFAGTDVMLCRSSAEEMPELDFTVTLDGAPIDPAGEHPTRPECLRFVPPSGGVLRAVPRLRDPVIELEPVTATVHPLSGARNVVIRDELCGRRGVVGVYPHPDGKFFVSVAAEADLPGAKSTTLPAPLPASVIRFIAGDRVVERNNDATTVAAYALTEAPPPGSRVEVEIDGHLTTAPVVVGACD